MPDTDTVTPESERKELGDKIDAERQELASLISDSLKDGSPSGEDKQEIERREKALGEQVDKLTSSLREEKSKEVEALETRLKKLEAEPVGERKAAQTKTTKDGLEVKSYEGDNYFLDKRAFSKGNAQVGQKIMAYEEQLAGPDREKAWATGDLEDVDLIVPDIQAALPFLAAQAQVVQRCRELRTTSPSVEFPVYTSGLTVEHVPEGEPKPEDEPTFDLVTARVYTIAGLTEVPNQTLEDYPVARGWISSELGRAVGVQEELDVLYGSGSGEPTGILNNADINGEPVDTGGGGSAGRDIVTSLFKAIQRVRKNGLTEPTDIVLDPAVWGDIVLSFEDNIGFLLGPPTTAGAPVEQPRPRLLGLPVTQSYYVGTAYGTGSPPDESPMIVGNFQDAVVLRRSPFRVDVDTSVGFKVNTTWFRGEERMGFVVPRPASFEVVTGYAPSA